MRHFLILALFVAFALSPVHADTPADRWNLDDLYASAEAWNADAAKLESQLAEIAACKGQLGSSAARLRQCLDLQADS